MARDGNLCGRLDRKGKCRGLDLFRDRHGAVVCGHVAVDSAGRGAVVVRTLLREVEVSGIYLVGAVLAAGLAVYLLVALLKPEWFS